MIIVLLILFIATIVLGFVLERRTNSEVGEYLAFSVGSIGTFVVAVIMIILAICVSCGTTLDDEINLYKTENSKIDKQVYSIVEQYKGYEQSSFKSFRGKNANTLVFLYPELKADTLVKKQIEIYNSNRKQIVKLKQEKIEQKPLRWWLYFGG